MYHARSRRFTLVQIIVAIALSAAGCGQQTGSNDAQHDHGSEMLQATAWSESHEVFMEYPHLIADVKRTLTLWVTDLVTAGPAGRCALTLRWTGEGEGENFVRLVEEAVRPGLYEIDATLPTAGYWTLEVTPDGAPGPVVIDNVHVVANHVEALHHHGQVQEPGADVITMIKEWQWRLALTSVAVRHDRFTHQVNVAATVQAPPERRVVVTTPVAGRLTVAGDRSLPVLGQTVAAGDPLVAIRVPLTGDSSALAGAEADLVSKRQKLQLAEAELERARTLVEAEAAPQRRVEEAESAVTAAQADYEAARRLLAGDGEGPQRILHAPIDGVVVDIQGGPGQYVDAGSAVVTVLDPTQVWVRGLIPETDLTRLSSEPMARLASHGDANTVCNIEDARLIYLSPEIDPDNRTAAVVYAVDNADGHLRVGQTLGLQLATRDSVEGLIIPTAALVDEHGRPVVFVQTDGETFVKRHVTVAGNDGANCLITEGLVENERVVVNAAWAVKLAGADSAIPAHGHTH